MAGFLGCTGTGQVGLCLLWFFVQELLEAQPTMVLVLKRLRRWGKWLEVSSYKLGELGIMFLWPCSLAVPVLAGWVYAFCGSMSRNS